jgi:purine-cytosine permease-like protein
VSTWFLGLTAVLGAGAISWVNYASDYSRYLPRHTNGRAIVGWVTLATVLPGLLYGGLGVVLGTLVDTSNPIQNLPKILPKWFLVPFLIVIIAGVIANNVMNSYSSGLSLLAMGLRMERYKSVFIDAILSVALACYALFVYNFSNSFTEFLGVLVILLAPWSGVFVVDYLLRRGKYTSDDLLTSSGGSYWYSSGIGWRAMAALAVGVVMAALTANTAMFGGYIAMHLLGGADLSPIVGFLLGAGVYYALAASQVRKSISVQKES